MTRTRFYVYTDSSSHFENTYLMENPNQKCLDFVLDIRSDQITLL